MKPQTYMNLSGEAVREAVQFYKIPADHVLVIYDDVSLPVGKLRVRPTGSAGGHNGIKNIIAHLGTQDFPRIKIGTGAPGEGGDMIDWVIGVPSQAERKVLLESFERAIQAAACIIDQLTEEIRMRHIQRLQTGECTIQLGFVLNDLLTNLERVSDHCSNIAVCVIEERDSSVDHHAYLHRLKVDDNFAEELREDLSKYRLPNA